MDNATFVSDIVHETTTGMSDYLYNNMSTMAPESGDFRSWITENIMKQIVAVQGNFWQGFIASLSVVIVSELGDKTFFIAAIMAMKHPRFLVFIGAISALVFMTILSAAFGWIATVVPRVYTYYISAALFAIFGIKMLRDGCKMDPNEGQEELEEVQSELKKREEQAQENEVKSSRSPSPIAGSVSGSDRAVPGPSVPPEGPPDPATPVSTTPRDDKEASMDMLEQGQADTRRRRRRNAILKVLVQAATLTFLAEWGDRSQLATVVLASREDMFGVVVGGSLGHSLCTGLAVIGGRMIAQKISVRTVTIIGGIVFLGFAVSALFISPDA